MYAYLKRKARPLPPNMLLGVLFVIVALVLVYVLYRQFTKPPEITDFSSCVAAGQPVIDTNPEQCTFNGQSYIKGSDILNR